MLVVMLGKSEWKPSQIDWSVVNEDTLRKIKLLSKYSAIKNKHVQFMSIVSEK